MCEEYNSVLATPTEVDLLRPIKSAVLADTDISIKPKYLPIYRPWPMCVKLHTVLWQQATREITCHDQCIICLFAPHKYVLFFAHIPFVVTCTFNAMPMGRKQHHLTAL